MQITSKISSFNVTFSRLCFSLVFPCHNFCEYKALKNSIICLSRENTRGQGNFFLLYVILFWFSSQCIRDRGKQRFQWSEVSVKNWNPTSCQVPSGHKPYVKILMHVTEVMLPWNNRPNSSWHFWWSLTLF